MACCLEEKYKLCVVREKKKDEHRYVLLNLQYEKAECFVLYAEDRYGCVIESVNMDLCSVENVFDRIVNGRLSACHLKDCLDDFKITE